MADTERSLPVFDAAGARITLFQALLQAVSRHGKGRVAVEDAERKPLSYGNLVLGALVLGRKLAGFTQPGNMSACCCRMCRRSR